MQNLAPEACMQNILRQLLKGESLSAAQTRDMIESLLSEAPPTTAQTAAYLYATAMRAPTAAELTGGTQALRSNMTSVKLDSVPGAQFAVDTCGTGGSGKDTFNTSTAAAFITAGAGCIVVKHGNRSSSSRTGSADVLEALGARVDCSAEEVEQSVRSSGFGFCFAPRFHAATKAVAPIRKELGVRTIFNFLGPLCNPAQVKRQIIGVSSRDLLRPLGA